ATHPPIDLERRDCPTIGVFGDHQDVADGMLAAELEATLLAGSGLSDSVLEEPEADVVIAIDFELVEPEVRDRVAANGVRSGKGMGAVVLRLRLRLLPKPRPGLDLEVVLRATAGDDVIVAAVPRVGAELDAIGS